MKLSLHAISIRSCLVSMATVLILPVPASYADIILTANLTEALEIPTTGSAATGFAKITLEPGDMMRVQVTFSGLSSGTTAAHIHCCLAGPFQNANVPVATTLPTFTDFPPGVMSGTYDHTFDLMLASSYNPNFINSPVNLDPAKSVAGAETAFVTALLDGETYLNIHTSIFGGGEIRGLLAVAAPGPIAGAGLPGLLAGFGVMLAWYRKRRAVAA